jgi:hypothetical protein
VLVEYGQHILANVIVGGSAPQQGAKTAVHDERNTPCTAS